MGDKSLRKVGWLCSQEGLGNITLPTLVLFSGREIYLVQEHVQPPPPPSFISKKWLHTSPSTSPTFFSEKWYKYFHYLTG